MKKLQQIVSAIREGWYIPLLFFIWRFTDIIIAYIADKYDNFNENFPYKFELYGHNLHIPNFLVDFANYDGAHYLHIAHNGYSTYEQAFFPLFPVIVKAAVPLFYNSYFLSGFYISNIFFVIGLFFFWRFLILIGTSRRDITWFFLFLLAFPTSFFFGAVYTEGIFFFLVSVVCYAMAKKNWFLLVAASFFAATTRLMGVFLCIPILLQVLPEVSKLRKTLANCSSPVVRQTLHFLPIILAVLAPITGLLSYMCYLAQTTTDPLLFYHAQSGFGVNRSTHIVLLPQVYFRYLKIFMLANHDLAYYVALLEFGVFNMFLFTLLYNLWRTWREKKNEQRLLLLGLNVFSLINILLPSTTGTLTSMPRYALLSLSFFLQLSYVRGINYKRILLFCFLLLHALLLSFFIQGYFIG